MTFVTFTPRRRVSQWPRKRKYASGGDWQKTRFSVIILRRTKNLLGKTENDVRRLGLLQQKERKEGKEGGEARCVWALEWSPSLHPSGLTRSLCSVLPLPHRDIQNFTQRWTKHRNMATWFEAWSGTVSSSRNVVHLFCPKLWYLTNYQTRLLKLKI